MMNDTEFENILKQALRPDISDEEILIKETPSRSKRRTGYEVSENDCGTGADMRTAFKRLRKRRNQQPFRIDGIQEKRNTTVAAYKNAWTYERYVRDGRNER